MLESDVVVILLSNCYIHSQFCITELGACWATGKEIIPVIIPPFSVLDLKATLTVTQVREINSIGGVSALNDDFGDKIGISAKTEKLNTYIDDFIYDINELIKTQSEAPIVSSKSYEDLRQKKENCMIKVRELREEIKSKDSLIDKIKKAKNATEIADIEMSQCTDFEKFEKFCLDLTKQISALGISYMSQLLYKVYYYTSPKIPNYYEEKYLYDSLFEAGEHSYFVIDNSEFSLDDSQPKKNILNNWVY